MFKFILSSKKKIMKILARRNFKKLVIVKLFFLSILFTNNMAYGKVGFKKTQFSGKQVLNLSTVAYSKYYFDQNVVWKLIYSDAFINVYSTEEVCSSKNSLRLKFENHSKSAINFSYNIWSTTLSNPKNIKLFFGQIIEGKCDLIYNNIYVETIPDGLTSNDVKVQITY